MKKRLILTMFISVFLVLSGCLANNKEELAPQITLETGEILYFNASEFEVEGASYSIYIPQTWEVVEAEACELYAHEIGQELPVLMITGYAKEDIEDLEAFLAVFTEGFIESNEVSVTENNIKNENIKTPNYSGRVGILELEGGTIKCVALETKEEYVMLMFIGETPYFIKNEQVVNLIINSFKAVKK
jgi:hypothetical protein